MERVACYVRVSTEEQKLHGISLEAQVDKLTEYADRHSLGIVGWYKDEGVSGRKLIRKRPELQRMLNDARAKKFDRIIFIKLDRFFRSVAEYHECMKLIDPVIWTATEEKYDLSTANGRAFVNMKLTIAELEADQTGERIRIVNDFKVKNGQPLVGARCQGLGFTVATVDGVKRVVQDPETKDMVKDMIDHYLTYQNKLALVRYISDKYNYHTLNTVDKIFKDTKLYGYYRGNAQYCEPYIDKDTFDRLQEILKSHVKKAPSGRVYLFSGTIVCPRCGKHLACCSNTHGVKHYRCNQTLLHKCDYHRHVTESRLEKELIERFDHLVKEHVESATITDAQTTRNGLNDRYNELKLQMKNTTLAFTKGRLPEKEYDRIYTELEMELIEIEKHMAPVKERDLSVYEDILKGGWKEIYNALNDSNRRVFWRQYIKEICINEDKTIKDLIFLK